MKRLLTEFFGTKANRTHRKTRKTIFFRLDALEDRMCPSCTLTPADSGHTLNIVCDQNDNTVIITQNEVVNDLEVKLDLDTWHFASDQITKIAVNLQDGKDHFTFQLGGGSRFSDPKILLVGLGAGNDDALFDLTDDGNGGQALIVSTTLGVLVHGANGEDSVTATFGTMRGSTVAFAAALGAGQDTSYTLLWGDLIGFTDVQINVSGGDDNDDLQFEASFDGADMAYNSIDLSLGASVGVTLSGNQGADLIDIFYSGEVDGHLRVQVHAGGGNDTVNNDVTVAVSSEGSLDAVVRGGFGADTMTFNLFDNSGGNLTVLKAKLNGGLGPDDLSATPNVTVISGDLIPFP